MGDHETAVKFFNAAIDAVKDNSNPQHLTVAYQLFSSACLVDPLWHEAHYQAGNNNSDLGKIEAAVANWYNALNCEADPKERAKTLVNIGWRLHTLGRVNEAREYTLQGIELDPELHLGWLNLSLIHGALCNKKEMVEAAEKAYALKPDDVGAECALAFAQLFNADYAAGFKHFEARFEWRLKSFLQFPYPRWNGEENKTVFLVSDQGLGDTLSFARFVEKAADRCKYMHLYIQQPLYRLFRDAFMHIKNVNLIPSPAPYPQADYWTTFVSLPYALGITDAEIVETPQIVPRVTHIPAQWKIPDRKLHIGIAWSGSPFNDINKYRNIPVEMFFSLYRVPGIQLYSLQKDEAAKQVHDAGGAALVRDITPYIDSVVDTVDILQHLDLVITCESALGHICALAGKECWIPYSYQGRDYRIGLTGDNMLWTPKHRVFRQHQGQDWHPVFDDIVYELKERVRHVGHAAGDGRREAGSKAAAE